MTPTASKTTIAAQTYKLVPELTAERKRIAEQLQEVTHTLIRAVEKLHSTESYLTFDGSERSAAPGEALKVALEQVQRSEKALVDIDRSWKRLVEKGKKA